MAHRVLVGVSGFLAALVLFSGASRAQCQLETFLGSAELLGASVDIEGARLVFGAAGGTGIAHESGTTHVLRNQNDHWLKDALLFASDGATGDGFGLSVGVSGETIVVGAPLDDDNGSSSGAIYVYRFDSQFSEWVETKIVPDDNAAGDNFGISVDISGDVLIAGAYFDDDNGFDSGSAYIFRYDGAKWIQEAKLLASDGEANDSFARSVGISGSAVVVGAERENESGDFAGAAYVFRYQGGRWVQEAKLLASDGFPGNWFGHSVDLDGDDVVVGAVQFFIVQPGAAYMFSFDGLKWRETAKVEPPDRNVQILFGSSVAINDGVAVVGVQNDDDNGVNSGSAFVYQRAGSKWLEIARLLASDGAEADWFGNAVAVQGNLVVVGAAGDKSGGFNSGEVYLFDLDGQDCDGDGLCDGSSLGPAQDLRLSSDGARGPGCSCRSDLDGDGAVGITDLLALLVSWGTDPAGPPDFDGNGTVAITDLLVLLASWGPCP